MDASGLAGRWARHWAGAFVVGAAISLLVGCGGGGGGSGTGAAGTPPVQTQTPDQTPVVAAPATTAISLQSDAGDPIGQGKSYNYNLANAEISVTAVGKRLSVTVKGDEDWTGDFQIPDSATWQPGRFENVAIYKPSVSNVASMRWYGLGRGCTTSTGWFAIDQADKLDTGLRSVILRFARYCDGSTAALKGEVRFQVADATIAPAIAAPPDSKWRPPAGATPAAGSFVYLSSDAADAVGQGRTRLYTPADTRITGVFGNEYFEIYMGGHETWYGIFNGLQATRLKVGYYPDLVRYPFANPVRGGLSWVGDGRGCQDSRGWVAIDRLDFDPTTKALQAIEYRFEQTCVGATGALRGAVRWVADTAAPVTPMTAAGTWHAPVDTVPTAGNYAYLTSTPGDFLGRGRTALFTPHDSAFVLTATGSDLLLEIKGEDSWSISLRPPTNGAPLTPGVYQSLVRFGDASRPSFDVGANTNGCGTSENWLAIDDIQYVAGQVAVLNMRFDFRCDSSPGVARGEIHWRADDKRLPDGPITDVPATLWRPQPGALPSATQSYLRVESSRADFVGAGLTATYTKALAGLSVTAAGNVVHLNVAGDQAWQADFAGSAGQTRLIPGFYSGLAKYPMNNPGRGGIDVASDARSGNTVQGWFAVDSVNYSASGDLTDIKLRFEQHASGSTTGGLWGELNWIAADATQPPGPSDVPGNLWRPAAGSVPASGNFVYLESADDFVTGGVTRTLTPANAKLSVVQNQFGATASVIADVGNQFPWIVEFKTMSSIARLQPGYYPNIAGLRFQNPAKGGLNFYGDGHGCITVYGWFVVDDVRYSGDTIVGLKARFEQSCEGSGLVHGQIDWSQ